MDWHGPHRLPRRRHEPDLGAWLSWVALAAICLIAVGAYWAGMHLP